MTAEALKNVLNAIYRRRGSETDSTKLFENWPAPVQERLLESIKLQTDELPVLAYVPGGDHWLLITTQRIVEYQAGKAREIECSQLKDLELALLADACAGARNGMDIKRIRLILTGGQQELIEIEPGPVHLGIWNLLMHFVTLNSP